MTKPCLLTIDIGGTKLAYGLLAIHQNKVASSCFYQDYIPTKKGLPALINSLLDIESNMVKKAEENYYCLEPYLLIGSAGNFDPQEEGLIMKGSAENLGTYQGEFDHVNLKETIETALGNKYRVKIVNDGLTQLAGGVMLCTQEYGNSFDVIGQKVAYIGPGTGLGGGFAFVKDLTHFDFFTDGHIFDIAIKDSLDCNVRAEDVLSGRAFYEGTGYFAQYVNQRQPYLHKFEGYIQTLGHYLGQIIETIHMGAIKKIGEHQWTQEEIESVKGITHFLLGGSLGTKGDFARILQKEAKRYLSQRKLSHVCIWALPSSEVSALIGAKPFVDQWLLND